MYVVLNDPILTHVLLWTQVKLVNIRNDDITDGNPKLTLGLIWTIILHFQVGQNNDISAMAAVLKDKLSCFLRRHIVTMVMKIYDCLSLFLSICPHLHSYG